uniref:Neurotransmitter-gated ion-channel ligand-binding domain-containing protein n=1 Tax=Acrobeloides nanus TaxID=290746 RepID=A0A914DH43_9BILA
MASTMALYNLLNLITLPTLKELNDDYATVNTNYKSLLPNLFNKNYDKYQPPNVPIEINTYLLVDHIESVNEKTQTMVFQATLLLKWTDKRLSWEPKDYGNLRTLALSSLEMYRLWIPPVHIKSVVLMTQPLMQYHNTEFILTSTGEIFVSVGISITSDCTFDFNNYPYDNQTCTIVMFSPMLIFSANPAIYRRESFFGNQQNNMTKTSSFELFDFKAERFYHSPLQERPTKERTSARMNDFFMSTVIRYELVLKRHPGNYIALVALPLFCSSIMTYIGALVVNPTVSILWLVACLALQILNYTRMTEKLPPNYTTTPFCAKMSGFLFVQTFVLILFRLFMTYEYKLHETNSAKLTQLRRIEFITMIVLGIQQVVNFYLILM